MNANDLWSGNDYAHTSNISRGVNYYEGASRVRVLRVFPENGFGAKRATMMVDVMLIRDDGVPKEYSGQPIERTVRARDIFMRWDEYERERKDRADRKEERAAEQQRAQLKEEQRKESILAGLEAKGIDRLWISSVNDYTINLTRHYIENWLNLDNNV